MIEETTVILSKEDAQAFKDFMQFYDEFKIIQKAGTFNIGYGKSILNFAGGILQNVVIEEIKYKR